jgi:hypothetical protein
MKKYLYVVTSVLACICLAACGNTNEDYQIPVQHWKDVDVRLETHPNPPMAGMSEIVIIITGPHGRPIPDMTVSMRGNDKLSWVQAIQDGMIGVYRRAVNIGDGEEVELQVRLQHKQEQKILLYPLKLAKG